MPCYPPPTARGSLSLSLSLSLKSLGFFFGLCTPVVMCPRPPEFLLVDFCEHSNDEETGLLLRGSKDEDPVPNVITEANNHGCVDPHYSHDSFISSRECGAIISIFELWKVFTDILPHYKRRRGGLLRAVSNQSTSPLRIYLFVGFKDPNKFAAQVAT
ncbi:uncharacterized protein LOC109823044 [Asparagus officinalis]|uniref:uncharacterized protein LOC109823044 n=1 Tax=Asparagus officinalis TaxID=4686 RepID=UPI00098E04D1|nr:uncharacterized protein LOC109823044 [Asparagus officinalis]